MKFLWPAWIALAMTSSLQAQVIYDVSFESPVHALGASASVGLSPAMPSYLIFGGSEIVAGGSEHGQVLQLLPAVPPSTSGTFSYSQFGFTIGTPVSYQYVRTRFDLKLAGLAAPAGAYQPGLDDAFTVLFDSPSVVRLDFIGDGSVLQNGIAVGNFASNSWISVTVDVDFSTNNWDIYVGSTLLAHTQFFHPVPANPLLPTGLDAIRINLADNVAIAGAPEAFLDNMQITLSQSRFLAVPEPSVSALLGAGSVILYAGIHMRRSRAQRRGSPS